MRTTVELSEGLFRRAKLAAVERHLSLEDLIAQALARELGKPEIDRKRMTEPPIGLDIVPSVPHLSNDEIAALMDEQDLHEARK